MSLTAEIVFFEVEEAFQIAGRGATLVTSTDLSVLLPGRVYRIAFLAPDGSERTANATMEMVLRRQPRPIEKFAMLARDQRKEDLPPGTKVSVQAA